MLSALSQEERHQLVSFLLKLDAKATELLERTKKGDSLEIEDSGTRLNMKVNDIKFFNECEGWVVGSYIKHTTDGGKTWEEQLNSTGKPFLSASFIDQQHGWAVNLYEMAHTTDGGENWVIIPTPDGTFIEAVIETL